MSEHTGIMDEEVNAMDLVAVVDTKQPMEDKSINLDADRIYRTIGSTGRWQLMMYMLHGLCYITHSWQFLGFIFIVDTPPYRCAIPPGETENSSIPADDQCNVYQNLSISEDTQPCTHGYWFDKSYGYESTIVTDFKLYCDDNIWVEICITVSSAALALSQGIANKFTDSYGRKKMIIIGMFGRGLMGVVKAIAPNMAVFIVFDVFQNAFQAIFTTAGIVMIVELFPPELRLRFGCGIEFFWLCSYASTCILVYAVRDWRILQLLFSVPLLLSVGLIWILPESLPWLCLNGHNKEAERVARRAAAFNGVTLNSSVFLNSVNEMSKLTEGNNVGDTEKLRSKDSGFHGSIHSLFGSKVLVHQSLDDIHRRFQKNQTDEINQLCTGDVREEPPEWHDPNPSIVHVFTKARNLRRYTLINFFVWFTNNIVYMSLSLTITILAGDRYLNFFIYWLAEIPAIIFFFLAVNKWGRRIPLVVFLIIAGVGCVLTAVGVIETDVDLKHVVTAFNFVGKLGITASYCTIITYAPEMYPTNIRSLGFGICWFWAILANLIAPYSRLVEKAVPGLVRVSCGILAIIAGVMCLWLPETFGRALPQTIADVEKWSLTVSKEEREAYQKELREQIEKAKNS